MSDEVKRLVTVDIDHNGASATVFIEEFVPGENMPKQISVGSCDWQKRHDYESALESILRGYGHINDRRLTADEIREIRELLVARRI